MGYYSGIFMLLMMAGAIVANSNEANAYIACDTHQISDETAAPNAVSTDLVIPFGYLCHFLEVHNKEISTQKAAYSSRTTVAGPLVKGICNWKIDFVYYDTKGNEYMRDKGETVSECGQGASRSIANDKKILQAGSSCVELTVDGKVRLIQCQKITD